jgi:hypothetical protein
MPYISIDRKVISVLSSINNQNKADAGSVATRTKRVLVLSYSQSGQLTRIVNSLLAPLRQDPAIEIHIELLRPRAPYPFPWSIFSFFDVFPESAHLVGPELEPLTLTGDEDFDLVILPYQVWFLAPSLPITAFFRHPVAQRLLRGKPVVTVIACRNMWMLAQEKMKKMLAACSARLIDNVVLTDPSPTLVTLVTTPWWLLTGRKVFLGFPPAGIDDISIARAERFGLALCDGLRANAEREAEPLLRGLNACKANPGLLVSERAGTRSFYLWGKFLRAAGGPQAVARKPLLLLYIIFLILLIVTVVPISLLMQALLRPLLKRHMSDLKQRFEMPSGSGVERMKTYGY